ncbi:MAG TPA: PH domain-containing protein [Longimicrobiaceae bacterium]|jgi:hypothetical protein
MPVDRGAIDAQLREIGEGERWWEHREFRDLPHILHADERILGLVRGRLLGPGPRLRPGGAWLIVVTDGRLVCLKQERFARKQVEIAAGQITRVQEASRLRAHQITITTTQQRYRLRIAKADAFRFSGALAPLLPVQAVQPLPPHLEPFAWIPGMTTVASLPGVAGVVSRVSMLAPPDYATRAHVERLESTVEQLQRDLEALRQQVSFLEDLLQKQSEEAFLQRFPSNP